MVSHPIRAERGGAAGLVGRHAEVQRSRSRGGNGQQELDSAVSAKVREGSATKCAQENYGCLHKPFLGVPGFPLKTIPKKGCGIFLSIGFTGNLAPLEFVFDLSKWRGEAVKDIKLGFSLGVGCSCWMMLGDE